MKNIAMHYDRKISALLQKTGELAAEADVAKLSKDREHYWQQSQDYFHKALVFLDLRVVAGRRNINSARTAPYTVKTTPVPPPPSFSTMR
jgi:hypothetical protein